MENKNSWLCLTDDHQMDQEWIFAETELFKGSSDTSHLIFEINIGSDMQRLWNWISRPTQNRLQIT